MFLVKIYAQRAGDLKKEKELEEINGDVAGMQLGRKRGEGRAQGEEIHP